MYYSQTEVPLDSNKAAFLSGDTTYMVSWHGNRWDCSNGSCTFEFLILDPNFKPIFITNEASTVYMIHCNLLAYLKCESDSSSCSAAETRIWDCCGHLKDVQACRMVAVKGGWAWGSDGDLIIILHPTH